MNKQNILEHYRRLAVEIANERAGVTTHGNIKELEEEINALEKIPARVVLKVVE